MFHRKDNQKKSKGNTKQSRTEATVKKIFKKGGSRICDKVPVYFLLPVWRKMSVYIFHFSWLWYTQNRRCKKKLDYNNITGVYMFRRLSCRFYVGYFDLKFYFIDLFYHSVCFETCIARKKFYFEKSLEIKILRFCLKFMSRLNSSFFMLLLNLILREYRLCSINNYFTCCFCCL